jgi:hypothetical protein
VRTIVPCSCSCRSPRADGLKELRVQEQPGPSQAKRKKHTDRETRTHSSHLFSRETSSIEPPCDTTPNHGAPMCTSTDEMGKASAG